jgi:hypothetical protein
MKEFSNVETVMERDGFFTCVPVGNSMWPLIRNRRDSVIIQKETKPEKYDITLYRRANGKLVLHRCFGKDENGCYKFMGDNQLKMEKGIKEEQILGVLVAFYRKEKKYYPIESKIKAYDFLWSKLFIIRLPFLALKRILTGIRTLTRKNKAKRG